MFSTESDDDPGPIVPAGVHLAPIGRRALGLLVDQALLAGLVIGGFVLGGLRH